MLQIYELKKERCLWDFQMAHLIEGDRNSKSAEGTGHHLGHIPLKILDYKSTSTPSSSLFIGRGTLIVFMPSF